MRDLGAIIPEVDKPDIFVAQLGSEARKECFHLYERLIAEDVKVAESFSQDGLKNNLKKQIPWE